MQWIGMFCLSAPFVCMIALVIVAFLQGLSWPDGPAVRPQNRIHRTGAAYALGVAFLCFSTFYHPRLDLAVTAQIRQQEQDDEDGSGDPESPLRHLLRQLRSIRRGDPVDRLILKLE